MSVEDDGLHRGQGFMCVCLYECVCVWVRSPPLCHYVHSVSMAVFLFFTKVAEKGHYIKQMFVSGNP